MISPPPLSESLSLRIIVKFGMVGGVELQFSFDSWMTAIFSWCLCRYCISSVSLLLIPLQFHWRIGSSYASLLCICRIGLTFDEDVVEGVVDDDVEVVEDKVDVVDVGGNDVEVVDRDVEDEVEVERMRGRPGEQLEHVYEVLS